jgi:hypothetical protein
MLIICFFSIILNQLFPFSSWRVQKNGEEETTDIKDMHHLMVEKNKELQWE